MDSMKAEISTTPSAQLTGNIFIKNLEFSGSHYYIYNRVFSVVVLAAVDADHRFTFVDMKAVGSESDGLLSPSSHSPSSLSFSAERDSGILLLSTCRLAL